MNTLEADRSRTVRHSEIESADPAEASDYLDDAYGVSLRVSRESWSSHNHYGVLLRHARTSVGSLTIDDLYVAGALEARPDALHKVVTIWPTGGRVSSTCGGLHCHAAADDVALLAQPHLPYRVSSEDLRATVVLLNPSLLSPAATGMSFGEAPMPIRFFSLAPVDATAARIWKTTVTYVKTLLSDDTLATPLVIGPASRLLAAVTLSTFPNSLGRDRCSHDRTDHQPVLLRRAIEFIEANAANDITLGDIAEAVHVTPRAVQYMFRRHLETTPLQYLRRLRLNHAHQELQARRNGATVTEIAARWGFAHTGRFAVLYRQVYGQSPHVTLIGG